MEDAILFLGSLKTSMWNGLDSIQFPILGASFLVVLISVLFINVTIWLISVLTGGRQNDKGSTSQKLDNNNNYIYRR